MNINKGLTLNHFTIPKILKVILLLLLSIYFIGPLLILIISSLKSLNELFVYPPKVFPKQYSLEGYKGALGSGNFLLYFVNTMYVAVVATCITLVLSGLTGYALAKLRFKGRNVIFLLLMTSTMISAEAILNGSFAVANKLGLYNKLIGVIIPAVATPTGVFIMRQAFMGVPNSLMEAARIDGASEFKTFLMLVPLVRSSFGVLAILSFMWRWNSFLWPYIILSDANKFTYQLGLANLITEDQTEWTLLLSGTALGIIPSIIIFVIFQKSFLSAHFSSGTKG